MMCASANIRAVRDQADYEMKTSTTAPATPTNNSTDPTYET